MSASLSGTGQSNEWQVDIDEISGTGLYGLQVRAGGRFYLQLGSVKFTSLEGMLAFLRAETSGRFKIEGVFGSALDLADFQETLALVAVDKRVSGHTSMLEIRIEPDDRQHFVKALADAIAESQTF